MSLDKLPIEILKQILGYESVSSRELASLSRTCLWLLKVVSSNEVWAKKFKQSYPDLFHHVRRLHESSNIINWKYELKKRLMWGSTVRKQLLSLQRKCFSKTEVSKSDLHWFDDQMLRINPEKAHEHLFIIDELSSILKNEQLVDLTRKHYAEKCIRHVKHQIMAPKLASYALMDQSQQLTYEEILIKIAEWCQPELCLSEETVGKKIDDLSISILSHLLELHPNHSIFSLIREEQQQEQSYVESSRVVLTKLPKFKNDKRRRDNDSLWSPQECRQIFFSANHVLYSVEEFMGNSEDYYNANNSFINHILVSKQGIPITLCLLYEAVMSRLGVNCIPVNFPGHFLLKWLEHPEEEEENKKYTFIDAFDRGKQMTKIQTRDLVPHLVIPEISYNVAEPLAVAQRMLRNLISIGKLVIGNFT